MRHGKPQYDPDDNGRWKAIAEDPDHVQYDETDWLRQNFTMICKACTSKHVVVCEDQAGNDLNILIVCEECGHHASVFCLDIEEV